MTVTASDNGFLSRVLVNSPIYALGEVLQRGAGILLLPLYTRFLSTQEYGAAIISTVAAGFAASIFSLHLQAAVVRFTYDAPEDQEHLQRLYGTVFAFTTLLSATLFVLGALAIPPAMSLLGVSDTWLPYAYLTLVIAATTSSYEILQRIMQAHYQAKRFVIQQWVFFAIGIGVTVVLMVGFGMGGLSLVIGAAVANVAFNAYALLYTVRHYGLGLDRRLLRECLGYSVSLLPNRFAGLIPRVADRFFLSAISVGAAGLYSAGYRLGEGLSYMTGGFFRAYLPWFYSAMREGESTRPQIIRVARQSILLIAALGIGMSMFAEEGIRLLLAPPYHEAWKIVPLAVSAIVFNSVKEFWLRPLTYEKSTTKYVPIATYTFAILSVAFLAVLVPAFGIMGAAWAILGARFISSFVMLLLSVRAVNVGYPAREIYGIAIAAFALSMIAYLPIEGLLIIKLAVAAVVAVTVTVVIRDDIAQLLHQIRHRPVAVPS